MFHFNLEKYYFSIDDVFYRKKKSVFLVLTPNKRHIIELKGVAAEIWENLKKPISFNKLLTKLQQVYDVPNEELKKDLKNWLKEALNEKIIIKKRN